MAQDLLDYPLLDLDALPDPADDPVPIQAPDPLPHPATEKSSPERSAPYSSPSGALPKRQRYQDPFFLQNNTVPLPAFPVMPNGTEWHRGTADGRQLVRSELGSRENNGPQPCRTAVC